MGANEIPEERERFIKRVLGVFKAPILNEGELKGMSIPINNPYMRSGWFKELDFDSMSESQMRKKIKSLEADARDDELLAIARAELSLAKETNQKNLIILHRSQLVSLLALIVAIAAVVVAVIYHH